MIYAISDNRISQMVDMKLGLLGCLL